MAIVSINTFFFNMTCFVKNIVTEVDWIGSQLLQKRPKTFRLKIFKIISLRENGRRKLIEKKLNKTEIILTF